MVTDDPIALFHAHMEHAKKHHSGDATAAALATTQDNLPHVRMVLIKHYDQDQFVFYTNTQSLKAQNLAQNPHAALCFYWEDLRQQIRISGPCQKVSDRSADAYFKTRPHNSQIGAWVSQQSAPMPPNENLEERAHALEQKWQGKSIQRPPHWGGFALKPLQIEFWEQGSGRLHQRILYRRTAATWTKTRLYP